MSINPRLCYRCGNGVRFYLHLVRGWAGYHMFVPEHKHVYKLVPEPAGSGAFKFRLKIHYLFRCDICQDFKVVPRRGFWHGVPKMPKLVLPQGLDRDD